MDEKTAMNVEFLRARLLSERIVSKTARQRAEMLSQRVIELEEQLRVVNIQRKKAEKAAEEVLSILETQGATCISRLTDSSTDREKDQIADQEGNQCIISEDVKEDKFLTSSRLDTSEVDDGLSCSDIDGSPSCLSWNSLDSQEKLKRKQNRHRQRGGSFIGAPKSSQRRPGKSCRKIKKSPDAGSASDNELQKPTLHGDEVVAHSDDFDEKREYPLEASGSNMHKFSVDSSLSFCPLGPNRGSKDGGGRSDMERALEQQAQLIIQFQAMENAQKEWEAKFNETKMSILDDNHEPAISSCSPNNLKLAEKEEQKDKNSGRCRNCEIADKKVTNDDFSPVVSSLSPSIPGRNSSNGRTNGSSSPMPESAALNLIETAASKALSVPPPDGSGSPDFKLYSHEQVMSSSKELYVRGFEKPEIRQGHPRHPSRAHGPTDMIKIPSPESLGLVLSRKDLKGSIYEKPGAVIRRNSKANFREQGMMIHPSLAEKPASNKETGSSLGSVLQSLQRARTSIKQELVRSPNSPINPNPPFDSSVLLRLPSDSFPRSLPGPSIYGSGLRLSATRPDLGLANTTVFTGKERLNQSPSSSFAGSKASFSEDYAVQRPFNPYIEYESRVSTGKEYFDRRSNSSSSAPSPRGYHPLYDPGLSSQKLPLHNELSKFSSGLRSREPYSERYSYRRAAYSPI